MPKNMKQNLPGDYPEVEIWLVIRYLHNDGVNVAALRDEQKARTYANGCIAAYNTVLKQITGATQLPPIDDDAFSSVVLPNRHSWQLKPVTL